MPQMMPLNWMILYFYTSLIFITIMMMNFYNFIMIKKSFHKINKIMNFKSMNWKF